MKKRLIASAASTLAAVLLPKCPMCIAGWLSVVGIGAGVGAVVALVLRPALVVLAITIAACMVVGWVRLRAAARGPEIASHGRVLALCRSWRRHCPSSSRLPP